MKIVVLIKQVPDTFGERELDASTGRIDREASDPIIDEISERALEIALSHKDGDKNTNVVALAMGPASVNDALRKALSMGADEAVHILDDALVGADATTTAAVLAAALSQREYDLIVTGNESTDGRGGVVPAMVAEHLGLPHLSSLDSVTFSGTTVSGERGLEDGSQSVHADLPAVISVTERAPEARFPNFKGIMTAKKKPLTVVTLDDLGIESAPALSTVRSVVARPARTAGTKVVDEGNAAAELVEFLAAQRLI